MKTAAEIYETMRRVFAEKTGGVLEDSSDLAVRLYAAAAELETLYGYCDWAMGQSFPQTATGDSLELHAALRGLSRREAVQATGRLSFSVSDAREDDLSIPAGTVCTTAAGTRFVTAEEGTIPAGHLSCTVAAYAESGGAEGCVPAHTVQFMPSPPTGVESCTNPTPFAGGMAAEGDESLRERVLQSYLRLPNGANTAYYEEQALGMPEVTGVQVLARNRGIGTVDEYIATDAAQEEAVRTSLEEKLSSRREIGTDVQVLLPDKEPVAVSIRLLPGKGVSFAAAKAAAEQAIAAFFTGALLGKTLYRAALGNAVYATGLVENYTILAPAADVPGETGVLLTAGTVTVTEAV